MSVDPEKRLAELHARLNERDAYELTVLTQVVAMPKGTDNERAARLHAWEVAMRYAPPATSSRE